MIPGPILIRRCARCEGLMKHATMYSGNSFGATYWTDGFMYAPMLPREEVVIRCPHCKNLDWIDDLEKVDSIPQVPGWLAYHDEGCKETREIASKWERYAGVPRYELPTADEMITFVDSR